LTVSPPGVVMKMSPAPARSEANANAGRSGTDCRSSAELLVACAAPDPDETCLVVGWARLVTRGVGVDWETGVGRTALDDRLTQAARASVKTPAAIPKRRGAGLSFR